MTDMQEEIYKCDECKATFKRSEIKFEDPSENFSFGPGMRFVYVDKDNKPCGGEEAASKAKGDKILACPKCNQVHLFGMDVV